MLCHLVPLPRKEKPGSVLVYLNVYDLTPMNGYAYWFGLGVYHSGVQVHGVEYGFGAHERETTGIFEVQPGHCPGFTFRKAIYIGSTDLGPNEVRGFMEKLSQDLNETKVGQVSLDKIQEGESKKMRSQSRRQEASSNPSLPPNQRHCGIPSSSVINASSSTIAVK
ncbi:unnamed protein product [Vicia faba]|uniref:PPPDE domain-containing protein n=1 Tax=Vicia faba TaxID=3906 RepID=A0AAV0ZN91_VICFA|nr:unnamed protein product [Vicia faba]